MPKWLKIVLIVIGAIFLFGSFVLATTKTFDGTIVLGILGLANILPALLIKPRAVDPEKAAAAAAHKADVQAAKASQRSAAVEKKKANKEIAAAQRAAEIQIKEENKAKAAAVKAENKEKHAAEVAQNKALLRQNMQNAAAKAAENKAAQQQAIAARKSAASAAGLACCPRCGSTSLATNQKGFGVGKAVVGAWAVGPIGLMAGNMGSHNITITCLNCGFKFKPGQKF